MSIRHQDVVPSYQTILINQDTTDLESNSKKTDEKSQSKGGILGYLSEIDQYLSMFIYRTSVSYFELVLLLFGYMFNRLYVLGSILAGGLIAYYNPRLMLESFVAITPASAKL
jgi:hypothetical protein